MKKINLKSKKGFTLIELLVVIGILAVLAAIAIPSVAGLIDRANVSADDTNSNEMTNAMERFASEYELYCQDIASGTLNLENLDGAQGRIYGIIGVSDRAGIEIVEIAQNEIVDEDTVAIYRDTKYPANAYTAQLIVESYMKTSSSTFEPKQSDMHFWYSPDCGTIVYAEKNANENIEEMLNTQIQSGKDAKGNVLTDATQWVDLTESSKQVRKTYGATFNDGEFLTWEQLMLEENGEKYGYDASLISNSEIKGRAFFYCETLTEINIKPGVTAIGAGAFDACASLNSVIIPKTVRKMEYGAFYECISLKEVVVPTSVTEMGDQVFGECCSLEKVTLPNTVLEIPEGSFYECYNLKTIIYKGTMAEWEGTSSNIAWEFMPSGLNVTIKCVDGTLYQNT